MEIKEIQSQILINREVLAELYILLSFYKTTRKIHDRLGNQPSEYLCHNHISRLKPKIARLVVLQKALKKDRALHLDWERFIRSTLNAGLSASE